jgi:hypothetical protein
VLVKKVVVFKVVTLLLVVVFSLGALKVVDVIIVARSPKQAVAVVDLNQPALTMNTLDVYPYDGTHTQADFIMKGSGGALWSGDHGFFIDFDLDNPPAKEPNEIRLINIGGSGAAGWGTSSNYKMVYHLLEKKFNERNPCGPGVWLRVINLAMGGTHSYQNYIALNRWAHPLDPDFILSYPGSNDMYVTLTGHTDFYYGYPNVTGFVELSRFSSSPRWQKNIAKLYPGLMRATNFGLALRSLSAQYYGGVGAQKYTSRYPDLIKLGGGFDLTDERQLTVYLENITKPLFIHAFKSMKRDFRGIPIMIAWQAYMFPVDKGLDPSIDVTISVRHLHKLYENLRRSAEKELRGYINDDWYFFDTHEYYHKNLGSRFGPGDGVHLTDEKTDVVSDAIAEALFPALCRAYKKRPSQEDQPNDGPFLYSGVPPPVPAPVVWQDRGGRPAIVIDGSTFTIAEGDAGPVELVTRVKTGTLFAGWAVDRPGAKPAAEVVVLANGRLVGRGKPARRRTDVATINPGFLNAGYEVVVAPDGSLRGNVRVFALSSDGTARELNYYQAYPFATGRPRKP